MSDVRVAYGVDGLNTAKKEQRNREKLYPASVFLRRGLLKH